MRYLRCKCGRREAWSSLGSSDCDVCPDCGSTLAESPSLHAEPIPHEWTTLYDRQTGEPYEVCMRCHARKEAKDA